MFNESKFATPDRAVTAGNTKSLTQVPAALAGLGHDVEALSVTVKYLLDRLSPALNYNATGCFTSDEPDYSCDLAVAIQQQAQALRRLDEYLRDALSWLEI